jgi:maleylacetoacetate isomerase/maleylpyruvate isomerase
MKGFAPEVVPVDLHKGEQRGDAYRAVNPQMVLPALADGDGPALFQSIPIIEYLDERYPTPPLLPADPKGRARVRGLAQIIASDAHPLIVPRVRGYLENELRLDEPQRLRWIRHWLSEALRAVETHLTTEKETGAYCHGDTPTLADICLVTHVTTARIFECDLAPYPTAIRIADACFKLEPFARAHPLKQPGAPTTVGNLTAPP